MTTPDTIIDDLARVQHGVLHRRQLVERGLSLKQIRSRIASGRLLDLGHGVLAVPSHRPDHLRQYKAAELAIRDAAIAGRAAGRLHELPRCPVVRPEIVVPAGANHRCSFALVHRRTDAEITSVSGIRVTTVAQTLVDLCGRMPVSALEDVWDGALVRNRVDLDRLEQRVEAATAQRLAHRGLARAMLLQRRDGTSLADSELELVLFDTAQQAQDIPPLVRQMQLPWWIEGRGRADVGIPDWRVILEADGRSWHARFRDFERDRARDNAAVAHGYVVLRFTPVLLESDPASVIRTIEATGRHRSAA